MVTLGLLSYRAPGWPVSGSEVLCAHTRGLTEGHFHGCAVAMAWAPETSNTQEESIWLFSNASILRICLKITEPVGVGHIGGTVQGRRNHQKGLCFRQTDR